MISLAGGIKLECVYVVGIAGYKIHSNTLSLNIYDNFLWQTRQEHFVLKHWCYWLCTSYSRTVRDARVLFGIPPWLPHLGVGLSFG